MKTESFLLFLKLERVGYRQISSRSFGLSSRATGVSRRSKNGFRICQLGIRFWSDYVVRLKNKIKYAYSGWGCARVKDLEEMMSRKWGSVLGRLLHFTGEGIKFGYCFYQLIFSSSGLFYLLSVSASFLWANNFIMWTLDYYVIVINIFLDYSLSSANTLLIGLNSPIFIFMSDIEILVP